MPSIVHQDANGITLASYSYAYDKAGRVTSFGNDPIDKIDPNGLSEYQPTLAKIRQSNPDVASWFVDTNGLMVERNVGFFQYNAYGKWDDAPGVGQFGVPRPIAVLNKEFTDDQAAKAIVDLATTGVFKEEYQNYARIQESIRQKEAMIQRSFANYRVLLPKKLQNYVVLLDSGGERVSVLQGAQNLGSAAPGVESNYFKNVYKDLLAPPEGDSYRASKGDRALHGIGHGLMIFGGLVLLATPGAELLGGYMVVRGVEGFASMATGRERVSSTLIRSTAGWVTENPEYAAGAAQRAELVFKGIDLVGNVRTMFVKGATLSIGPRGGGSPRLALDAVGGSVGGAGALNGRVVNVATLAGGARIIVVAVNRQDALEGGLTERDPQWPWRGLHEEEAHHPLMQGPTYRRFWQERRFSNAEIESWTVNLDKDIHGAISSAPPGKMPWWDEQLLTRITTEEAAQGGRPLSKSRILEIANELLGKVQSWSP